MHPDVTAIKAVHGGTSRPPSKTIHPALQNLDRLSYTRRKLDKKGGKKEQAVEDLMKWQAHLGLKALQETSMTDLAEAGTSIQSPNQIKIARENKIYALQTNAIEGWVKEPKHPKMTVLITSTHSFIIGRHVTILVTLMFG